MVVLKLLFPILFVVFLLGFKVNGNFEFTNIKCTSLDKEYMDFDACFLKSKNRTYKFMTFRTKIHKLPFEDLLVRFEVLKRLNGYKPFLFNVTFDVCQYFKGKRNPTVRFFIDLFATYSNFNHSCPYNHDIYVDELPIHFLNHKLTTVLPVPEGEYCVHSIYTVLGIPRMDLKVFVRIY